MKTDMSPEAVTARLELMDELWELGTELQAAGAKTKQRENETRKNEKFVMIEDETEAVPQDL